MLQFWVALPKEKEEMEASFEHHDAEAIPHFKEQDAQVRLIAGSAFGKTSPVNVFSKLFFMSIQLKSGGKLVFDTESQDAALYLLSGALELSQTPYGASSFITFKTGTQVEIQATEPCELVLFGGESLPEPRTIYWNFVATSKDKIEAAKTRWQERKFPKVIHDEDEYTPLPPQF
jgi:redox-sensitive bicupin YhaK (pirin superfamily)